MPRESKNIEYKEDVSKSYLKTVSAYANYNDGEIVFGVKNDLSIIGIDNPVDTCLVIENQINDLIKPRPMYTLRINDDNTITLFVRKGCDTPYRYNGKAYIRNDSSTIEVDSLLEKRLILEGMSLTYEEMPSNIDNLSFSFLSDKLLQCLNLSSFNIDILKSLNLYSDKNGYNNAAHLLSDSNSYLGLDFVVFGNTINEIRRRYTFNNMSIIKQYYEALDVFEREYVIEKIEGGFRRRVELIPLEAYREAMANALIHRVWDINANIKVEMHPGYIRISSPGGLPSNMSNADFMMGNYSYLRNPIIADVFHRLGIVEKFATGIRRINNAYASSIGKPIFDITPGAISITLPVLGSLFLTKKEAIVFDTMKECYEYSRLDLENLTGIGKDTLIRILNSLYEKSLIYIEGVGRSVTYRKK